MKLRIIIFVVMCMGIGVVYAGQHIACTDINYDYLDYSAKELRNIAMSCTSAEVSQLYYNRAYHADLLDEGKTLSELISHYSSGIEHHFEAYRLYIALIESMALLWYPDAEQRVAFLNKEYEQRGEVAELRLHGYDRLADAKERQFTVR